MSQGQERKSGQQDESLWAELNSQTARISWQELEKHFARGVLVTVSPEMDLVEVAINMVRDNSGAIQDWMREGKVLRATDEHALAWSKPGAELWAAVAAPWVLVQQR